MTKKLVHVDSYVKDDGTKVKEHYRGGNKNEEQKELVENEGELVLKGGISYDEELSKTSKNSDIDITGGINTVLTVLNAGANIAVKAVDIALQIKKAIDNFDEYGFSALMPQMNNAIETLKQSQEISFQAEQKIFDKLVNTKNQKEYSKIYDDYLKIRDLNRKNQNSLQKIEYAVANQDFNTVHKELQNYSEVQSETENELKKNKKNSDGGLLEILVADMLKNNPEAQKNFVGLGLNWQYLKHPIPDAKGLWDISVSNFEKDVDYLNQNAYIVNSISELPQNLQQRVQAKVSQQLGVTDAKGVVFYTSAGFASQLINSVEYKDFITQNIDKLLKGEIVSGSYKFKSNSNLSLSLGHADILDAYMDNSGNIISYVLDTYDFNKNDSDWRVGVAYNIQKKGGLTNYFVLIPVVIPKEVWSKYFI